MAFLLGARASRPQKPTGGTPAIEDIFDNWLIFAP